jgi:hypothetical protein
VAERELRGGGREGGIPRSTRATRRITRSVVTPKFALPATTCVPRRTSGRPLSSTFVAAITRRGLRMTARMSALSCAALVGCANTKS